MPVPQINDVLDDEVTITESDAANLVSKYARAVMQAAYWQGVAEERQEHLDSKQARIEVLEEERDLTISYLKDRLNKAESPKPTS